MSKIGDVARCAGNKISNAASYVGNKVDAYRGKVDGLHGSVKGGIVGVALAAVAFGTHRYLGSSLGLNKIATKVVRFAPISLVTVGAAPSGVHHTKKGIQQRIEKRQQAKEDLRKLNDLRKEQANLLELNKGYEDETYKGFITQMRSDDVDPQFTEWVTDFESRSPEQMKEFLQSQSQEANNRTVDYVRATTSGRDDGTRLLPVEGLRIVDISDI